MNVSSVNAQAMNVPLALQSASDKATPSQGKAVAQQFEAILTRQFLSKTVSSMMDSDKNPAGDVYGYFLTDVLAQKLSEGGGLGLGKVLEKQFGNAGQAAGTPSTNILAAAQKVNQ